MSEAVTRLFPVGLNAWVLSSMAVGLAAGALRLVGLELIPLDSREARVAVSAWQNALGHTAEAWVPTDGRLWPNLLVATFWLFGASDASARLIPALAGTATCVAPFMLSPLVGKRATMVAAIILGLSPIGVEASRRADPAALSGSLMLIVVYATLRLASNRPYWAPWLLAGGMGLALVHEPATVVGIATALLAAAAVGSFGEIDWRLAAARLWHGLRSAPGPVLLGVGFAVLSATGGLMDLRGLGYLFGDLWGALPDVILPSTVSVGYVFGVITGGGPIVALAICELARSIRTHDRFDWFLGVWAGLLLTLGLTGRASGLSFALLPTLPLALLAGRFVGLFPMNPGAYRLTAGGWSALALSLSLLATVVALAADSVGSGRAPQGPKLAFAVVLLAGTVAGWRRAATDGEHWPAATLVALSLFALWAPGAVGRLSFGGSPLGTEPLSLESTAPAFRDVFRELTTYASVAPRLLFVETEPRAVGEWYGRAIRTPISGAPPSGDGIVVRPVQDSRAGIAPSGQTIRVPWRVRSTITTTDLHPLGVARWLVTRQGLFTGQMEDVWVTR